MSGVETNDIETFYHDYGDGHPLVVLHGATADHRAWAEQLQPLTDEYRILLYDLRGHGNTGRSALGHYTVDTYVDDLVAFIEALNLDQPVVLGHSWGGMIGYRFAATHPEQLSALISVGSMTPNTFSTKERLFRLVYSRVLTPAMTNERLMNTLEWILTKVFGDDAVVDQDELQQLRDAHDCDVPSVEVSERRKILRAVHEYWRTTSWQLPATPVLMLYGEHEPYVAAHGEYLETELDDCHSTEIPDASHNSQVENPEFIRQQIRDFLETTLESYEARQVDSQG